MTLEQYLDSCRSYITLREDDPDYTMFLQIAQTCYTLGTEHGFALAKEAYNVKGGILQ